MLHIRNLILFLFLLLAWSCTREEVRGQHENPATSIKAVDISAYNLTDQETLSLYDSAGQVLDVYDKLLQNGFNTIRLRLWHSPQNGEPYDLKRIAQRAKFLKNRGFSIWLCPHYSDIWADPGHQTLPAAWQGLSYELLKDSLRVYTEKIVLAIEPDIIQLGNEINNGWLHPFGSWTGQKGPELLTIASRAVRTEAPSTTIMVHHAGLTGFKYFREEFLANLDYDLLGISYYPWWHGKELEAFHDSLMVWQQRIAKPVMIAETAYPFTLQWQDNRHNPVGDSSQLLNDYPASPRGQQRFVAALDSLVKHHNLAGWAYWEPLWLGSETGGKGSPWENNAFFDFKREINPVLDQKP